MISRLQPAGLITTLVKTFNHIQGIASNPSDVGYLLLHISLNLAVNTFKPIKTRVLVGQSSAGPCLRIAHLKLKRVTSQVLQFSKRLAQVVHRVRNLFNAISKGSPFSAFAFVEG